MKKIVFALLLMGLVPPLAAAEYVEGRHYLEIPFGGSPDTGDKVEVREFFWYGCQHCLTLEPIIDHWLKTKPKKALFVRTPAFLPRNTVHAKAFYTFESLGVTDKLHGEFFDAVQIRQQRMADDASVIGFAVKHGVDEKAFTKAYNSFGVDVKVREATMLAQKYGLSSVPTLVVDGRYLTTATMAGGNGAVMQVVNQLVEKAAKERASR